MWVKSFIRRELLHCQGSNGSRRTPDKYRGFFKEPGFALWFSSHIELLGRRNLIFLSKKKKLNENRVEFVEESFGQSLWLVLSNSAIYKGANSSNEVPLLVGHVLFFEWDNKHHFKFDMKGGVIPTYRMMLRLLCFLKKSVVYRGTRISRSFAALCSVDEHIKHTGNILLVSSDRYGLYVVLYEKWR